MLSPRPLAILAATIMASPIAAQSIITLPAADKPITAEPVTLFTVGKEDGNTADVFGDVASVAFDAQGNLHVLDADNHRVVVFDPTGKLARSFGRQGRGPGELQRPSALAITADGSVVVRDVAVRGYHFFDRTGKFIRVVRQAEGLPGPVGPLRAHPHGGLVTEGLQMTFGGGRSQGLDYVPLILQPTTDGAPGSLLFKLPAPAPTASGAPASGISISFGRKRWEMHPSWGVLPNGGIAAAYAQKYEVAITDGKGNVQQTVQRAIAPRPWTSRERRNATDRERANLANGGVRTAGGGSGVQAVQLPPAEIEKRLAAIEWADAIAPIRRLATDPTGRIWVLRTGNDVTEPAGPIDIISGDLRYVGTLSPQTFPDAFGPEGRVAYIVTDDVGLERVVVKRFGSL